MSEQEPLNYKDLLRILDTVLSKQDSIFHHTTVHAPKVSITEPAVWRNMAHFSVEFTWRIPINGLVNTSKLRWTRAKNVEQFMVKLEKAAAGSDLQFAINWSDVEFGVRGGDSLPNNVARSDHLVMYVTFLVKAAPAYVFLP